METSARPNAPGSDNARAFSSGRRPENNAAAHGLDSRFGLAGVAKGKRTAAALYKNLVSIAMDIQNAVSTGGAKRCEVPGVMKVYRRYMRKRHGEQTVIYLKRTAMTQQRTFSGTPERVARSCFPPSEAIRWQAGTPGDGLSRGCGRHSNRTGNRRKTAFR